MLFCSYFLFSFSTRDTVFFLSLAVKPIENTFKFHANHVFRFMSGNSKAKVTVTTAAAAGELKAAKIDDFLSLSLSLINRLVKCEREKKVRTKHHLLDKKWFNISTLIEVLRSIETTTLILTCY